MVERCRSDRRWGVVRMVHYRRWGVVKMPVRGGRRQWLQGWWLFDWNVVNGWKMMMSLVVSQRSLVVSYWHCMGPLRWLGLVDGMQVWWRVVDWRWSWMGVVDSRMVWRGVVWDWKGQGS